MFVRVVIRVGKLIVLTSHAIVVETLAELIADDEEHRLGIRQFLQLKKLIRL